MSNGLQRLEIFVRYLTKAAEHGGMPRRDDIAVKTVPYPHVAQRVESEGRGTPGYEYFERGTVRIWSA
jgi:hypothetical protein